MKIKNKIRKENRTKLDNGPLNNPFYKNLIKIILILILIITITTKITKAEIEVSSCINITNPETYTLNQNITGTGTCIRIMTDNTTLDCKGNTITYNTAGLSTNMGIDASNGTNQRTNITIKNCIIKKPTNLQTAGYGIRLTRYGNSQIINNTIYTDGTTNNYGIYLLTNSNNNTIENNTIYTTGTSTGNHGIYLYNGSNNNITKNTIYANGTTTNYGIYLQGISTTETKNNNIEQNNIYTNGISAGSNHGIYLYSNANENRIINNTIRTQGSTTNNYGIYILGTTTIIANNNTISNNNITTNGTTANYGIVLSTNANKNNITNNYIRPSGQTTSHAIFVSGTTYESKENTITENNIIVNGTHLTTSNNYGIYLYRRANDNIVEKNNITTYGTSANYGIVLGGTTAQPTNNNTIKENKIITTGRTAGNNYGIYLTTYINNNNITNNDITTTGTTTNYGIYLTGTTALPTNNNLIKENNIQATGTTTNNYGIALATNTNNNTIIKNNITTRGTSGNIGIYIAGTAALTSNENTIEQNNIYTNGTINNNFGIYILTNANNNTIKENEITTYGTTTNHGIYLSGTTFTSNNNQIIENNITARGSTNANYGIHLYRNISFSNITKNKITTNGTTTNYGIYLLGTATLIVGSNNIEQNELIIKTADLIRIDVGSKDNIIKNNTITERNSSFFDINILSADNNGTKITNQNLERYNFGGTGEIITIENEHGQIAFTQKITGTGTNLTQAIIISENYVYVNSSQTGLNKSATITLNGINYQYPIILKDGISCTNCNIISNNEGTITFNVPHFSSYSVSANSKLEITDNSEENESYGHVRIIANYTNITNGEPINGTNVFCNASFNGIEYEMNYNTETEVYEIEQTFPSDMLIDYSINCNGTAQGFEAIEISNTINFYKEIYGPRNNYNKYHTRTTVNVTGAMPEILNISCNGESDITLTPGTTKNIPCEIKVRDYNGANTITSLNATIYHQDSIYENIDDNNSHYTNASCSQTSIDGYNATWNCSFDIWYYAKNGSWNIRADIQDERYSANQEITKTILPLYAINVTPIIDYGALGTNEYSNITQANITNLGNMNISVSVYTFGGEDELTGTGVAFICQQNNISFDNERYSLNSLDTYENMNLISGIATTIPDLSIAKQIISEQQSINTTYWQLFTNSSTKPGGQCNGTIIFSAEAN
jgi:parallel beta-helix repeat protein